MIIIQIKKYIIKMLQFVLFPVMAVWIWQFINWVWIKPKRTERLFRAQGMKGTSYKFFYGDTKETGLLDQKPFHKPLALDDDLIPQLMPNIFYSIKKYGNMSFMWEGPRPRVFVIRTDLIKEVMSKYRIYQKPYRVSNHTSQMVITGIASMEGDQWTKARLKLNPAFNVNKLKKLVPAIQGCGHHIIEEWKEMISKNGGWCEIDVSPYTDIFTSSVLAQLMFSTTYTERIKQTFFKLFELSSTGKLATYSVPLPGERYLPTKQNRKAKEINNFVRASFISMINERLRKRKGGQDEHSGDLLDLLLGELYEEKCLKERDRQKLIEEVIAHCKIFFFAGYETTSNALTWTMIMLSVHQDWQKRAREEVFQVLGDKKEITQDDLSKLTIITMIVNEIMRLYPSGKEISRIVDKDTKLGDYFIPKDTIITLPTLMVHRNKQVWGEDAGKFNPERFAEGAAKATKGEMAFLPFGGGPRICIGQNLPLIEMKLFIAMITRNFCFHLSPNYVHAPNAAFTIYPQHGAPLIVKKI